MTEPPWAALDPGIVPLVRLLYSEGIETVSSCQGGHEAKFGSRLPVVVCDARASQGSNSGPRRRMARVLIEAGWTGFSIEEVHRYDYQSKRGPKMVIHQLVLVVWTLEGQPE